MIQNISGNQSFLPSKCEYLRSLGFIHVKEILNFVMTRIISPNEGRNSVCNLHCKQSFDDWTSVTDVAVGFNFHKLFLFLFRNVIRFEWHWENTLSNLTKLIHLRKIIVNNLETTACLPIILISLSLMFGGK